MKALFILNEGPYGTERSYNGLRLAGSLVKRENQQVKIFLIGDGAQCVKQGQKLPQGYYNIEIMAFTLYNNLSSSEQIGQAYRRWYFF